MLLQRRICYQLHFGKEENEAQESEGSVPQSSRSTLGSRARSPWIRYQAVTSQHAGPAVPPSGYLPPHHSVNTSFTGRARPDQAQHNPGPSRNCGLLLTSPDSCPANRPGSPRPLPTPPLFPFWATAQPSSTPPPSSKQRACLCSRFPH